ncbi:MAG: hypothetical protein IJW92_05095 [Clostridia bacterium]|nr:hypothetical protein [Clostridia bacterium]
MKTWSVEEQKKRIENIRYANENVKKCTRHVRIHDYLPGQVTYNLGPYPAKFSIEPTEYDYNLIKSFAEQGVGLIQVHEEWNDHIRLYGADKYSSHDPQGMKHFIKLCHDFGIKILPYLSSFYFDRRDPDFRRDFMRYESYLISVHFEYANCSAASETWGTYFFDKMKRVFDEYDFDGIYNDTGCEEFAKRHHEARAQGRAYCTQKDIQYDPYEEDFYARMYSFVKENHGIMKMHYSNNCRPASTEKLYDYLWVGEGVADINSMLDTITFDPYLVPCPDLRWTNEQDVKKLFAQTIPFLQFPIRPDGRPYQAEKIISVPNVKYKTTGMYETYQEMAEYDRTHPNGPYCYSDWSGIPDNEDYRAAWFRYLALYKPMVEENNVCHMNITESTVTLAPLPKNVYMSLFTGNEQYLCISNLSDQPQTVVLRTPWENRETGAVSAEATVPVGGLCFLKRI